MTVNEVYERLLRDSISIYSKEGLLEKLQSGKSFFTGLLKNPAKVLSYTPSVESAELYADETIDSLIKLKKELLEGNKTKTNLKWHNVVDKSIFKGADKNTAIKDALVKFQKSKIAKGKWIKTSGGFLALGIVAKPIDNFVEKVILQKYFSPGLDKLAQITENENS